MFRNNVLNAVVFLVTVATSANAASLDGMYTNGTDPDSSLSCNPDYLSEHGGTLAIKDGFLYGLESACELTKPTNVRGMDAVLYEAVCSGEGEQYSYRVMIMPHETGVYLASDGYVAEWQNCP